MIEGRLQQRAAEAMYRANLKKLADVVNDALRRAADRADGREDELRAELAKAEVERDRLVDAIANGGDSFAAVRDRLEAVEGKITGATADLERARFEKRAARTPTVIRPSDLRSYLRAVHHAARRDVPTAKRMIMDLLVGDLVLTPATDGEPPHVTGQIDPARLVGCSIDYCGGRI